MDKVEYVARTLCWLDQIDPDALALPPSYQLVQYKYLKLIGTRAATPAWFYYVEIATRAIAVVREESDLNVDEGRASADRV